MSLAPQEIAELFDARATGASQWQARCPCHDDRKASLCIGRGDDGRTLVHCQAGCATEDVLATQDLSMADLMPANGHRQNGNGKGRIVATYNYRDERGEVLYRVHRFEPKDFRPQLPGGEWKLGDVRRVLYRLPELLADTSPTVFYVEGEKDADNGARAGLQTTCNVGGAGKWRPEYGEALRGRHVVVIADKDKPGRAHAANVKQQLTGIAASVMILELPGDNVKDLTDWLNAGGTRDELMELIAGSGDDDEQGTEEQVRSFAAMARKSENKQLRPIVVDGIGREGETINVIADPKCGKTWFVHGLALAMVAGREWLGCPVQQGRVLILDNELHEPTLVHRIQQIAAAMGLDEREYADNLHVECFRGKLTDIHGVASQLKAIASGTYKAVILDSVYRFAPKGFDENSNSDTTELYNLIDSVAEHLGAMIVCVRHTSKGSQAEKKVTDIGAGAGAQSRAVDCHLALRAHEEEGAFVMQSALRSFPKMEPVAVRFDWPVFYLAPDLDPMRLATTKKASGGGGSGDLEKGWTPARLVSEVLTSEPKAQTTIICDAMAMGLSERRAKKLLDLAAKCSPPLAYRWIGGDKRQALFASVPQTTI